MVLYSRSIYSSFPLHCAVNLEVSGASLVHLTAWALPRVKLSFAILFLVTEQEIAATLLLELLTISAENLNTILGKTS